MNEAVRKQLEAAGIPIKPTKALNKPASRTKAPKTSEDKPEPKRKPQSAQNGPGIVGPDGLLDDYTAPLPMGPRQIGLQQANRAPDPRAGLTTYRIQEHPSGRTRFVLDGTPAQAEQMARLAQEHLNATPY